MRAGNNANKVEGGLRVRPGKIMKAGVQETIILGRAGQQ